jgi:hypothetical protein
VIVGEKIPMADFTTFLRDRFQLLKDQWPGVKLDTVTDTDLFYSDGSSAGSVFKLVALDANRYDVCVVYVFPTGEFTRVSNPLVNQCVFEWVTQAKAAWSLTKVSEDV